MKSIIKTLIYTSHFLIFGSLFYPQLSQSKTTINLINNTLRSDMILKKTWKPDCPLSLDRLRQVVFSYVDFGGTVHHDGELIIMDVAAPYVAKIMEELYKLQFPIHQAKRIDEYRGCDELSMEKNNSSAFNFRVIEGKSEISIHGYGLAIDINPEQNPVISHFVVNKENKYALGQIHPRNGINYLNRHKLKKGMVESIVDVFFKHGFRIWGGQWNNPIDYHHFQVPRWLAKSLAKTSINNAKKLFDCYVKHPEITSKEDLFNICKM